MKNLDEYEILERAHEAAGLHMMQNSPRADELIACLEGEIAKRDEELAACRVAVENCEVFRARVAELEANYGTSNKLYRSVAKERDQLLAELAAIKAQGVVMPDRDAVIRKAVGMCNRIPGSTTWNAAEFAYDELAARLLAELAAAPAAPAADAGIVDMYRHLQTVTPYRFKKIQDASVTDGGDVLYFHKDRFDAALLDDMAANCAKESK